MAVVERLKNDPSPGLIEGPGALNQVVALLYLAQMIPEKDKRLTQATLKAIDRMLRLLQVGWVRARLRLTAGN